MMKVHDDIASRLGKPFADSICNQWKHGLYPKVNDSRRNGLSLIHDVHGWFIGIIERNGVKLISSERDTVKSHAALYGTRMDCTSRITSLIHKNGNSIFS